MEVGGEKGRLIGQPEGERTLGSSVNKFVVDISDESKDFLELVLSVRQRVMLSWLLLS